MKVKILIFSMFFSGSAKAATWVNGLKIQSIYAGQEGQRFGVSFVGGNPNHGCAAATDWVVDSGNPKYKEITSILLTAAVSGKTVNVYTNGCAPHGPILTDVKVNFQ